MTTTRTTTRITGAVAGLTLAAGVGLVGATPAEANAANVNFSSLRTCQYGQRQMQLQGYRIYLSCHKIANNVWSFYYYY
ncbi:hypothetical protein IFT73_08070 [Aeromicrobium sp. CFBP 8757]|uniref:hypothetical protein n=1 Tax=Aeromicrobium sp. CFBP 8757 TaxID=2775288 RepID=UPI00177F90F9|nr:hypothetical protein [Aeromicrobium sp. CFBP 8757]MBD8606808.1 hypothetical protein [Aeromicrobium sp. CFBP 8757]